MSNNPTSNSTGHILLVDDEPDLLAVNSKLLSVSGFEVSTTTSGQEAAKLVAREKIDLVILDMMMPQIDGVETLKRIRAARSDQKVVILSGFSEGDKIAEVRQLGVLAFLKKPFESATMVKTLRDALDGKRSLDIP